MHINSARLLHKASIITQDFLFGRFCYICMAPRSQLFPICRKCLGQMPAIKNHCLQCGHPLPQMQLCGKCLVNINPINVTIPAFIYQDNIKNAILQIKHQQGLHLLQSLAKLMLQKIITTLNSKIILPQALIAVPSHRCKLWHKGYNQSLELTKQLTKLTSITNLSHSVIKTRNTLDQASLSLKQRKLNLTNCFAVKSNLPSHIAIIDDVITTGITVKELASTLKNCGVDKVDVWCLAKAVL